MTEGLAAIQMRMAEIRTRFAVQAPPVNRAQTPASSGTANATFQDALARATTQTAPTADLSKYANGRIPDSALTSIGGGEKLAHTAARAFLEMQRAAVAAGVRFSVNDSYRSYDAQVAMAKEKGLYGRGGLAAVPGTSNHGKGLSVDLELNGQAQSWMRTNAAKFGFKNDVAGEPWHWTFTK